MGHDGMLTDTDRNLIGSGPIDERAAIFFEQMSDGFYVVDKSIWRFQYINPAAFDYPRNTAGQPTHIAGNASRNSIEQPGINNWDLGVSKNTYVHERFNVQFRWEMFNAWNHTQFGPANLTMTSANVGKITSSLIAPRRMQFGLRLKF